MQEEKAPSIGNASADDVKLEKVGADRFAFSAENPMQHGGNTAGFAGAFGTGAWSVLGTVEGTGNLVDKDKNDLFAFSFTGAGSTSGTWTITNTSKATDAVLDLTVAIHASNASTAFLFENQTVAGGQTLNGTWQIEWQNTGGNVPGFSNLVFFGRESAGNVALLPVPEPATLPMVLAGLAVVGTAAWRRRGKRTGGVVA
ncbi:PEP-CTERM sorting domain-containing protein [Pseudoduganella umbonata]|uniref:PEP-CTERM sorting domain-containing protein n=1 Tax=Pseudoduganella umbonata TaxID=864828 RepID=A0ABX5UN87_9BURK|nr:PEP-CTERM sorting domain-containing protein [Pseudoduganella umbonata]